MENQKQPAFFAKKEFRKVYFLIAFSIIGLVVMFVLLNRISVMSEEISAIRKESVSQADASSVAFLEADLENISPQVEELRSLYASDSELVLVIQEIDRLRREGVVESFSFVSNDPIKDKSGNYGIPISVVFRGTEEQVDAGLRNLQSMPFLMRGVQVDVSTETAEDGNVLTVLQFGGFLYVEEPKTN